MGERRGLKALELWCRRVTEGYRDVHVVDMSSSWRDGLAFCALIHHFRPDLIEFDSLRKGDVLANNRLAFSVAESQLGIPALLDAEDMLAHREPDRLSVATYVSQFYQYFEGSIGSRRRAATAASALKRPASSSPPPPLSIGPPTKVAGDSCHTCRNRVFLLERLMVDGRLYHRSCFRCSRCDAVLSPGAYNECDNAPGTYECTVCPKDEGPEFALAQSDEPSPKSPSKGSPATAVTKPEIPEKKLELTESVRVARKLFQSAMVAADTSTDSTTAADSLDRNGEGSESPVAKWKSMQKPELPEFLRRRDEPPKTSTVRENIKRFSQANENKPAAWVSPRSGPRSVQAEERSTPDRRLADSTPPDSLSARLPRGQSASPRKTTPLDLPVIKSDVPVGVDAIPRPAPRTRTLKLEHGVVSLPSASVSCGSDDQPDALSETPPPLPSEPPPSLTCDDESPEETLHESKLAQDAPSLEIKLTPCDEDLAPSGEDSPDQKSDVNNVSEQTETPSGDGKLGVAVSESPVAPQLPSLELPVSAYPTDLNPFGEDEEEVEEEYPESLNPFGDEDDDSARNVSLSLYDDSLNPFSEGDDASLSSTASPRRPSPRARKKQAAPPPPVKKSDTGNAKDSAKDSAKDKQEKDQVNKSIQDAPSKSTFAYWKRKKRPAPSVPVPVRREIKRIPLKEIQAEMEEIAVKQEELERQGREIEMQIRDRNGKYLRDGHVATAAAASDAEPTVEEEEMIMHLFELVNEKNNLFRRQAELMYIKRSQRLEEEQVELEYQIRCIMTKPLNQKCEDDAKREEELLQRLLEVVEARNEIVDSQEMDRRRVMQEDWSIQEQMAQKQSEIKEKMVTPEPTPEKKHKKKEKHKKSKSDKKRDEVGDEEKRKSLKKIFKEKLVLSK
ncbi:MICAL-like protein isoform X1 [Dermacentor variabilis]|uniref:MICAL-like protein isoform X1 n=2 Tax=Dermacentor variabilis TaxID=34621 RepID=UPI003F5B4445